MSDREATLGNGNHGSEPSEVREPPAPVCAWCGWPIVPGCLAREIRPVPTSQARRYIHSMGSCADVDRVR